MRIFTGIEFDNDGRKLYKDPIVARFESTAILGYIAAKLEDRPKIQPKIQNFGDGFAMLLVTDKLYFITNLSVDTLILRDTEDTLCCEFSLYDSDESGWIDKIYQAILKFM